MRKKQGWSEQRFRAPGRSAASSEREKAAAFLRQVFVLRAGEGLDSEFLSERISHSDTELLVLSVGHPQTRSQREGVAGALHIAAVQGLPLEARLVWNMDEALDALEPGDQVFPAPHEESLLGGSRATGVAPRRIG